MLSLPDVAVIILINVKMPNNCWQLHIYEHDAFHVHVKSFITSGPAIDRENHDLAHLKIRYCSIFECPLKRGLLYMFITKAKQFLSRT